MNETMKMAQSLGLYLCVAKKQGKTYDDCLAAADWQAFLRPYEAQGLESANMFGFSPKPIDDITLDFNQFCEIAEQVFVRKLMVGTLSLPYPAPPAPAVAHKSKDYFNNYLEKIGNDARTQADVESIMGRINELLMRQPATSQRTTGLVVGRVQSGKTRNYVGLALKAIDEGWNVIIVLTSCNTALVDQTETRILKDFEKSGLDQGPDFAKLDFRTNQAVPSPKTLAKRDYVYLGVAMKQKDNLDQILGWLNDNTAYHAEMRLLLIDDEADNATPDSNQGVKNTLDDDKIDSLVDDIRNTEKDGGGNFGELAGWVELVREDGDFSDEGDSPDAQTVRALRADLQHAVNLKDILKNPDYKRILYLEAYNAGGVMVDVCADIPEYFNGKRSRSPQVFIKLLNTLLGAGVARSAINRRICAIVAKDSETGAYNYAFGKFAYVAYTATPFANMFNERPDQTPLYPGFIKSLQASPQYFGFEKIFGEDFANAKPCMNIVRDIPECTDAGGTDKELRFILRPIQKINDLDPSGGKKKKAETSSEDGKSADKSDAGKKKGKALRALAIQGPDENLHVKCADPHFDGYWETLQEAIEWFFCTAAARRWYRREVLTRRVNERQDLSAEEKREKLADLEVRWTTMMVNISEKTDIHGKLKEYIDKYLRNVCSVSGRAAFIARCGRCWTGMTASFTADDFSRLFNVRDTDAYGDFADYPAWQDMLPDLVYFVEGFQDVKVHTVVINSENGASRKAQDRYTQRQDKFGHWDYRNTLSDDHAWIVIGGNTIGRGLTLSGLTASYFDRVRKTAAVDTLTQMGRWFGHRNGYELLPRIWMTTESVREMKKMCVTENHMHDVMRENFDAGYSPSDDGHYQQVYYWGRRLSGRQRNLVLGGKGVGTTATTDDISAEPADVHAIYTAAKKFIAERGAPPVRSDEEYQFWAMPLWQKVHRLVVRDYLAGIIRYYPQNSQRKIASLIREIEASETLYFDVVIGEPVDESIGEPFFVNEAIRGREGVRDGCVKSGHPTPKETDDGLRYSKVRSDMAFYAMIKTTDINRADHQVLEEGRNDVLGEIRSRMKDHGGKLPAQFEVAFGKAGANGTDVAQRLDNYIAHCNAHPEFAVAACIHACFPEGARNRSSAEYCELVHEIAGHETPVLQLYFITPPGWQAGEEPYISHSFYWPKHDPGIFQIGTVAPPPPSPHPTRGQIWTALGDILRNNGFPMTTHPLKNALMERFPQENETIYWVNVVPGQKAGGYCSFPGKSAYYSMAWAEGEDPVEKVNRELLACVVEVLRRDHGRHLATDIVEQVKRENPRFEGVGDFSPWILNQKLLTDENMKLYGIRKVCGHPITYQAD